MDPPDDVTASRTPPPVMSLGPLGDVTASQSPPSEVTGSPVTSLHPIPPPPAGPRERPQHPGSRDVTAATSHTALPCPGRRHGPGPAPRAPAPPLPLAPPRAGGRRFRRAQDGARRHGNRGALPPRLRTAAPLLKGPLPPEARAGPGGRGAPRYGGGTGRDWDWGWGWGATGMGNWGHWGHN